MKKFLISVAVFAVLLSTVGAALLPPVEQGLAPRQAEASHHVWLFCHKADWDAGYKHYVKDNPYVGGLQGGVHTKYKCLADQGSGWWYWVLAPWPH